MKAVNKVEMRLEISDKGAFVCDADMPLAEIYEFAGSLQHFVLQKLKEIDEQKKESDSCNECK